MPDNHEKNKKMLLAVLRSFAPELAREFKFPIKARVVAAGGTAGKYVCDVKPLNNDESEADEPVLTGVEIPSLLGGPGWGLLCLPAVGQKVAVGFYRADPHAPFVIGMRSDGQTTPAVGTSEMLLQYAGDVRIEAGGAFKVKAASALIDAPSTTMTGNTFIMGALSVAMQLEVTLNAVFMAAVTSSGAMASLVSLADPTGTMAAIRTLYNSHTHTENGTGGGTTNSPNQQML